MLGKHGPRASATDGTNVAETLPTQLLLVAREVLKRVLKLLAVLPNQHPHPHHLSPQAPVVVAAPNPAPNPEEVAPNPEEAVPNPAEEVVPNQVLLRHRHHHRSPQAPVPVLKRVLKRAARNRPVNQAPRRRAVLKRAAHNQVLRLRLPVNQALLVLQLLV